MTKHLDQQKISNLDNAVDKDIRSRNNCRFLRTKIIKIFIIIVMIQYFKGSSDPCHFIFEINIGNRRIRHTATPRVFF